jgi:UDP-perosamine 4-acetyltransferase
LGESLWSDLDGVAVEPEAGAARWVEHGVAYAIVAIGNNSVRERVGRAAIDAGFQLATVVSPFAYVSRTAVLGVGTVVMAGAVIQAEATVGDMCIVNSGASIDHECRLGRAVHAAPHSTLCGNVVAGDRTWIGAGATVIEGTQIADDVFVAAGAVIVCDIMQAGTRVRGVPAKPVPG